MIKKVLLSFGISLFTACGFGIQNQLISDVHKAGLILKVQPQTEVAKCDNKFFSVSSEALFRIQQKYDSKSINIQEEIYEKLKLCKKSNQIIKKN